jgi:hypothetical protein
MSGRVTTEAGEPIDGVVVTFIDTGLDSDGRHRGSPMNLGQTANGTLDVQVTYSWGYRVRGVSPGLDMRKSDVPGTFTLHLQKSGYDDASVSFSIWNLQREGSAYKVVFDVTLATLQRR